MPEATSNVDRGAATALGAVLLGLVVAMATATLVLANGYGIFLAFLAYSLAGAAIVAAGTAGRLAVRSASGHVRSAAPRHTRSGTFA